MKQRSEPMNRESTRNASRGLAMAVVALVLAAGTAWSQVTVTCSQVGADVVCNGGGSLDLTGLPFSGTFTFAGSLAPQSAVFVMAPGVNGTGGVLADGYAADTIQGPGPLGSGPHRWASSGSKVVGISPNYLVVPKGYVSSSDIPAASLTFSGQTAATLGVTPGVYVWTWGNGPAQKFTLNLFAQPPSTTCGDIDALINSVKALNLQPVGKETALVQKLDNAVANIRRGSAQAAKGQLGAFVNQLNSSGSGVSQPQNSQFQADANAIIGRINNGDMSCP